MITIITGTVIEKLGELLVLDVHGVGYGVLVTTEELSKATNGEKIKLYIYEHIRDDAHDLYGFSELTTRQLYGQLLSVNGVGPKMALSILNVGKESDVRAAIARGDTKWLALASSVGKRVAERIVVDLKDKVGIVSSEGATSFLQGLSAEELTKDDAAQALITLGFTANDAANALRSIDEKLPTEERVKQALKGAAL